ncbi:MAG: membrane-bound serine protease (ClpP class) [Sphingobacteriales bacterium]|jgi:membrane-bound serine protease (ClpP class)
MKSAFVYILLLFFGFGLTQVFAQDELFETEKVVYTFEINEEIAPPAWRKARKAYEEADKIGASYVAMQLNTYGGLVDMADSIRTAILNAPIPTIVYIPNNAASAGALISIACSKIYMNQGARMGAATVVNQTGEAMPDKYQSYMRATMRATAEATGRDPRIAEAMVDQRISIPDLIDSGQVLTFTTSEAIKHGFCNGGASSLKEAIANAGWSEATVVEQKQTFLEKIIDLLINPAVSSVLILIIIGGIYFELQTPGVGFPILAAAIAAMLYFAPLYIEGLAENWEILLFVAGVILLIVEIFVIPGFGIPGIAGIICIVSGLALSLVFNNNFDFTFTGTNKLTGAFMLVLLSMFGAFVLSFILGKRLLKTSLFQRLILNSNQNSLEGYNVKEKANESMVSKIGTTITVLRPSGKVEIENVRYDAISSDEFIEKGVKVKVLREESRNIVVQKV